MNTEFNLENQLCFEVYKASNQFTKLYRHALEEFDLTYSQYLVLLSLWEQDQLLVKELSEKVTLGIGTLNPIINKLVNKGWLTKEVSSEDKRAVIVSLTKKAKKEEVEIKSKILEKICQCDALVATYSELKSQIRQLNNLLEQLNEME
ncbi:MarR family winged helix-turn-helix transcriptional regulator [Rummeliibacillus pycnus]|uniref:MarR family winged helix-turn-helix transcriptional regulator n=1 Tax=Rummeliibacillus pycnus TaxID=101070 RepID=UPI000C9AE9EA|nr:MarR family transcriptional regulator [Rummeliibacillus pycnus]